MQAFYPLINNFIDVFWGFLFVHIKEEIAKVKASDINSKKKKKFFKRLKEKRVQI